MVRVGARRLTTDFLGFSFATARYDSMITLCLIETGFCLRMKEPMVL